MIQTKGNNIFVKVSGPPLTIDERVTIIIPCYKQAKFVKEALDSCLKQTRKPKQIIILLMDVDSWKLKVAPAQHGHWPCQGSGSHLRAVALLPLGR